MKNLIECKTLSFTLFLVCFAGLVHAGGTQEKSTEVLNVKKAKKLEVRQSQIGFRSTLLFYTFSKEKAVVKFEIGNRTKTFPMKGTVYLFAKNVTEEGISKWLNNQHSDGLFPDVPEPVKMINIPEKFCKVTSFKLVDQTKLPFGTYDNFDVTFEIREFTDRNNVTVPGFTGETKVHIKIN